MRNSVAKIFNDYFTSVIKHLYIERNEFDPTHANLCNNPVLSVVNKFQNHPSILKIKSNRTKYLDISKTAPLERIHAKTVRENSNVFAIFLVKAINSFIKKGEFLDNWKTGEITPAFKKGAKHDKSNYRPLSILAILSKVYEKCLHKEIENYVENILSNFQFCFRKDFNRKQCLIGLLTDLLKAFGCLLHDLIIAKLDCQGFKNDALCLIFNYLSNGKQRVIINLFFTSFQNIISCVPKGFLLGLLLFNIFLTDIFIFCPIEVASYADDNTPYATGDCLKTQTYCLNGSLIIIWSQMQTNVIY